MPRHADEPGGEKRIAGVPWHVWLGFAGTRTGASARPHVQSLTSENALGDVTGAREQDENFATHFATQLGSTRGVRGETTKHALSGKS
jgi:hypothetical protein